MHIQLLSVLLGILFIGGQLTAQDLFPVQKAGKWGYINAKGEMKINAEWEMAHDFSEGMARVQQAGKIGYINEKGELVIEAKFGKKSGNFSNGLCYAQEVESGNIGFINKEGEQEMRFMYDEATDFSDGLAAVKNGDRWGYIDEHGATILKFHYTDAHPMVNGVAVVQINGIYGYIDKESVWLVPPAEDFIYASPVMNENIGAVMLKGKGWGIFDNENNKLIDHQYRNGKHVPPILSEGLLNVRDQKTKKYGYINKEGEWIIKPSYSEARHFSEGLAAVSNAEGKWGFIDAKGKLVIPYMAAQVENFSNGVCRIIDGDTMNYLNKEGKKIWKN